MKKDISLYEALVGFKFNIEQLDGNVVTITTGPGEIIRHGESKMVRDLGLPVYKETFSYGNLYIEFNVVFPDNCLLYTSPSPRDATLSRMPSSA